MEALLLGFNVGAADGCATTDALSL